MFDELKIDLSPLNANYLFFDNAASVQADPEIENLTTSLRLEAQQTTRCLHY